MRESVLPSTLLSPVLLAFLLVACESGPRDRPSPPGETLLAAQSRAAAAADLLGERLVDELRAALEAEGPARAIEVCSEVAPRIAAEVSAQTGVEIRRTALRTRNPLNAPDSFERATMERWLAADAEAITCCEVERSANGHELRWMRPIRLVPFCVQCHGEPDAIDPEVRALLAERYPDDQAVGFHPGELRGDFSARVPLD